jgi:type II secretory pathway pseudopilin PulG
MKNKGQFLGFSLLETMVAVSILVFAIAGPMTLASMSIRSATRAKDNLIASHLAQDGIELIRNVRTTNVINGFDWLDGLGGDSGTFCFSGNGCYLDATDPSITIFSCSGVCPYIGFDEVNKLYTYLSGTDSKYIRTIKMNVVGTDPVTGNPNEVRVTSSVAWVDKGIALSFSTDTLIFDWQ